MNSIDRILPVLAKTPYFTKQNLGLILRGSSQTLNYWISRLIAGKQLTPLKKGFYASSIYFSSLSQNPGAGDLCREYFSNILREPSYVSLEYVLSQKGLIPETVSALTAVSPKSGRIYRTEIGIFVYKTIKPSLFFAWETKIFQDKTVKIASLAKALFDYLYLKKFSGAMEMADFLKETGRLNWAVFAGRDRAEFRGLIKKSQLPKMKTALKILRGEGVL